MTAWRYYWIWRITEADHAVLVCNLASAFFFIRSCSFEFMKFFFALLEAWSFFILSLAVGYSLFLNRSGCEELPRHKIVGTTLFLIMAVDQFIIVAGIHVSCRSLAHWQERTTEVSRGKGRIFTKVREVLFRLSILFLGRNTCDVAIDYRISTFSNHFILVLLWIQMVFRAINVALLEILVIVPSCTHEIRVGDFEEVAWYAFRLQLWII